MRREWHLRPVLAATGVTAALAVGIAACGGDPASDSPRPQRAQPPSEPAEERQRPSERTAASPLPNLVVAETAGGRVALPELAPRDRPLLVWFWAPH